jgi:hypothetical protein
METDKLRGRANQDQELAEIDRTWAQTEGDMQDELVSWLADDNPGSAAEFIQTAPPEWIWFIQKCCLAGLREAVIQDA